MRIISATNALVYAKFNIFHLWEPKYYPPLRISMMNELSSLKRQDLQRLCKENGIKASGKNAELIGHLAKIQYINNEIVTSVAEPSQIADAIDTKHNISANKGNTIANTPFTFTFSSSTFGDAVTAAVLAEMELRVSQAKKVTNPEIFEFVGISKFEPKDQERSRSPIKGFFENAHTKNFKKMDSIADHYAAKRPFKSIDESDDPEEPKKLFANSVLPCKSPFKKQKCGHDKTPSSKAILDKQPSAGGVSAVKQQEKKRLSVTQRMLDQRIQAKTPRPTTANRNRSVLQESRIVDNHPQRPKRLQFDLNASLAKKPKYVPYTGPVIPFANKFSKIGMKEAKENSRENRNMSTKDANATKPIQGQTKLGRNYPKTSNKNLILEKVTKADTTLQRLKP